MLEAIAMCEQICGQQLRREYVDGNRAGDHIWWISDIGKFQAHYPSFRLQYDVPAILRQIHDQNAERWLGTCRAAEA
jgi:CDP-paratose 2-epimerase